MPLEIERKFLVETKDYRDSKSFSIIKQAYLLASDAMAIRVRIDGIQASLAVKSKVSDRTNKEYEYNIPIDEARSMMNLANLPIVHKTRYLFNYKGYTWEIDEFHDENEGLVVAEIELNHESEKFDIPIWIGKEVTSDYRYLNSNLALKPFSSWSNS